MALSVCFSAFDAGDVLEQFLDQVDMGQDHATAAVALQAYGVKGIPISQGFVSMVKDE